MNPVGMLINKVTGRFHPIVFRPAPFLGNLQPPGVDAARRHL